MRRWRSMFSSTTIELSTSMPTAKVMPARLITLMLRSKRYMKKKVPITEMGMATATVRVELTERR